MIKSVFALLLALACARPLFATEQALYSVRDVEVTPDFIVRDFCIYPYSDTYLMGYSRILYTGRQLIDYVRLDCHFYRQGVLAGTTALYGDYGTYGQSGMRPGTENYYSSIISRTDFDSIAFTISYDAGGDLKPLLDKGGLEVLRPHLERYGRWSRVSGQIRNVSTAPIAFPSVLICFYKEGQLVQYQRAFADIAGRRLQPGESAPFYSYIDPVAYDDVVYLSNSAVPEENGRLTKAVGLQTAGNPVLFYLSQI